MKKVDHGIIVPLSYVSVISLLAVMLHFAVTGCRETGRGPVPATPVETAIAVVETKPLPLLPWGNSVTTEPWTRTLMAELASTGKDLLTAVPADIEAWCPRYSKQSSAERLEFWAQLIAKMTEYESGFNPAQIYVECSSVSSAYGASGKWFPDRGKWCIPGHKLDGGVAISRGLTQMSLESAQGYKCPLSSPAELHEPAKNLSCAVRVFNRFVPSPRQYEGAVRGHGRLAGKGSDGKWKGAAAYWAVMRETPLVNGKASYARKSHDNIRAYTRTLAFCKQPNN